MRGKRLNSAATILAIAFIGASCTGGEGTADSAGEPINIYDDLVAALREGGSTVDFGGSISQPFFDEDGRIISVDGHDVQIFEFSSEEDANTAAETISSDGSSIGTTMISWIAPPHFYKSGKLIVLYVGLEDLVVKVLEDVLGPQIAGGKVSPRSY